jgi:hypothetical protein
MEWANYKPGVVYGTHRDTENFAYDLGLRLKESKRLKGRIIAQEDVHWREGDNYLDVAKRIIQFIKEGRPLDQYTTETISCLPAYQKWKQKLYEEMGPLVFELHNSRPSDGPSAQFALHAKYLRGYWQNEFIRLIEDLGSEHDIPTEVLYLAHGAEEPISSCEICIPEDIRGDAKIINPELVDVSEEFRRILSPDVERALLNCGVISIYDYGHLGTMIADPENPRYQQLLKQFTDFFEELFVRILKEAE